ncbi:hypothetical protein E2C01_055105 [Portunus trituberculatus]|uniref:Uncharacterized protein n=1 Tax=Portunus trituberculatus TaxID=210409 RepID=A0A5B7GQA9_PORTR|nr:hypothetical protein [Portunus trituberculatus]
MIRPRKTSGESADQADRPQLQAKVQMPDVIRRNVMGVSEAVLFNFLLNFPVRRSFKRIPQRLGARTISSHSSELLICLLDR